MLWYGRLACSAPDASIVQPRGTASPPPGPARRSRAVELACTAFENQPVRGRAPPYAPLARPAAAIPRPQPATTCVTACLRHLQTANRSAAAEIGAPLFR